MAKLTLKLNGKVIHAVELDPAREYFAGRSDDCDFALGDYRGISRQHLKIFDVGGVWHCESLSKFLHPRVGEDNFETLEMNENVVFSLYPYDFEFETEAANASEEEAPEEVVESAPEQTSSALVPVLQKNRYQDSVYNEDTSGGFSGDATQVGTMQLISSLRISYPSSSDDETLRLEGQVWTAGREADCEIQLHSSKVSRKHFELHKTQDGYFVTDLGSSNGTYLNGHRIPPHEPTRLMSGDSLRVLDIQLHFEVKAANLPAVTMQPLVLSQVPWPAQQMPVPFGMHQQPGPYEFDQTLVGIAGADADEGPLSLTQRIKKFDWKKNKVRVVLMALVPVLLIGILSEPEKKEGGKDPSAAADPNSNAGFDNLSPEQKVAIKDSLGLAQNLYVQGKYSLCLAELAKLHETVPFYGNSKELESFCIQGHELTQRKLDNERKEREKAMVEQQIADITGGCMEKFKTEGSVDEARICLAPAMELNPEHPKILELLQIAESREKEKELIAQRNQEEVRRRSQLLGILSEAQRQQKSGQLVKARTTYTRFISQAGGQLPSQVGEAKRELASVSKNLQEKMDLMMAKCKSLGESGKFKEAYISCEEALKEDGSIQEAKELMEKYEGNLRREMKVLYEDAKLEESLGNLEAAKEKWKKIREEDLNHGDFNKKSTIKLRQYGVL